jgi:glycosyltransferase involved in cell wall biosynthesis
MTADTVGGIWRYSLELGAELIRRGVQVTIATLGAPPDPDQRREAERANIELYAGHYRLEWMEDPWADVERAGDWLLALADVVGPDLVHLNGYAHGSLPWRRPHLIVAHSCVCSWWEAVHGAAPPHLHPYRRRVREGLQATDWIAAPSQAMLQALHRHYGPLPAGRVIHNGSAGGYQGMAKRPLALAVGRAWDAGKNFEALSAAAPQIAWPVCLIGPLRHPEGGERALPGLRTLGSLDGETLARWYGMASLFIAPARYEPFGLAALEAARAGCALILGDIPSQRELWDGAAVFVDHDDPEALAAAAGELINNASRRRYFMKAARERARRYSITAMANGYLELYADMLQETLPGQGGGERRRCAS